MAQLPQAGQGFPGNQADYSAIAKLLHWLIAAFILAIIPIGIIMVQMRQANEAALAANTQPPYNIFEIFSLYQLHKSLGITVLGLMVLRLAWRLMQPPPALPQAMPALERQAAHGTHLLLYFLLFALPLTGWALVSVEADTPIPTLLYQTVPLPHIPGLADAPLETKKTLDPIVTAVHTTLGFILLGFVLLHIMAALRHGILLRDGVMSRMLPHFAKRKTASQALALFALGAALYFLPGRQEARASEWGIKPEGSTIEFTGSAAGQTAKGTVSDYTAEVTFDVDAPQLAAITLRMKTAGITFGRRDYDSTIHGAEWFDVAKYPQAVFTGRGAEKTGDGQYRLNGQLTFKGVTKPLGVPFTIEINGGEAVVTGEAVLKRSDHGIGPASMMGMAIDDAVKISFELKALRLDN